MWHDTDRVYYVHVGPYVHEIDRATGRHTIVETKGVPSITEAYTIVKDGQGCDHYVRRERKP